MSIWCDDYRWEKGVPQKGTEGSRFLIFSDPYGKRFIIEAYENGLFTKVIYDSHLLDYRKLNPRDKLGWSQETLIEGTKYLLRDREHTPILIEEYSFEGEKCRACHFHSPHHLPLGYQKIFYKDLGDSFNGVTLFDTLGKKVVTKKYDLASDGSFGELIEEE